MSDILRTPTEAKCSIRPYCAAISRRQYEATSWGDANIGCSRLGVVYVEEGDWVCQGHADPAKRYGMNGTPIRGQHKIILTSEKVGGVMGRCWKAACICGWDDGEPAPWGTKRGVIDRFQKHEGER